MDINGGLYINNYLIEVFHPLYNTCRLMWYFYLINSLNLLANNFCVFWKKLNFTISNNYDNKYYDNHSNYFKVHIVEVTKFYKCTPLLKILYQFCVLDLFVFLKYVKCDNSVASHLKERENDHFNDSILNNIDNSSPNSITSFSLTVNTNVNRGLTPNTSQRHLSPGTRSEVDVTTISIFDGNKTTQFDSNVTITPSNVISSGISAEAIIASTIAGVFFLLLSCGILLYFMYFKRTKTTLGNEAHRNRYTGLCDENIMLSYINSQFDLPRESQEEMISLENDAYLNSLESMTAIYRTSNRSSNSRF